MFYNLATGPARGMEPWFSLNAPMPLVLVPGPLKGGSKGYRARNFLGTKNFENAARKKFRESLKGHLLIG